MNPINATRGYAGPPAEAAYSRWAPIYDLIFDLPFHPGRVAAARAAAEAAGPGGEILVVGVGTGLELPLLPGNVLVTGIDISAPMLRAARGARRAQAARAGQGPARDGRGGARISRRRLRRRARALCDERRSPSRAGARRSLAGVEAGRNPGRDEPFCRPRRTSRGDRASDGDGRRLARLASEFPLLNDRRLDRLRAGRADRRAQRTRADEAVHAAAGSKKPVDAERRAGRRRAVLGLFPQAVELTFAIGRFRRPEKWKPCRIQNPSARAEGRPQRG